MQNPFSYLDIKNKSLPDKNHDISRNLKVTLDILTKMHYNDFNNAGDKKAIFNPMDLIQKNPLLDDDVQSHLSQ